MTTFKISTFAGNGAAFIVSLLMASHAAIAQDQEAGEWGIKPTEQHQVLTKEVGAWDAVVKVWPMGGGAPIESKGVEKNQLLKGGLWLISRFEGDMFGTPFVGIGTFGYDPAEEKYVGNWVDTMTPHMMVMKSDYDEKSKTMTGTAETRDPITGEKYTAKMITRFTGDDTRVMEMHRTTPDGKDWKAMEISYKRSKKQ